MLAVTDMNNSVQVILPLVVIAGGALLVLLVDLFLAPRSKGALAWVAAGVLVVAMAVAAGQWVRFDGGLKLYDHEPEAGFGGMVALDKYALFFVVLFATVGLLTILLSDAYLAARGAARGEFYVLLLLIIAGMIGMATATDVITLFVSFELMSLPTYVLASYSRHDPLSREAGLKYYINGAFSSAVLLFGLAVLYAISGQTNYALIADGLGASVVDDGAAIVAFALIAGGFGFKVAAVPFHQWAPDVYEGAPTPVTAFMSVAIKAAAFAGFLKLFAVAAMPASDVWTPILTLLSVVTMVVGNVLALPQRNLKRLLAYSSIAHAGYLLLGIIAVGHSDSDYGSGAVLVYLAAYVFMNLGAFGMLVYIRSRRAFGYSLDELRGLGRTMPVAAITLTLFMLSLTGIPPTAGFWGKFYLFSAVVDAGQTWLAVVAVLMSTVSAFYYLRVVWYCYFEAAPGTDVTHHPEAQQSPGLESQQPAAGVAAVMLISAACKLFIGLWPTYLLWAAQGAVQLISGG